MGCAESKPLSIEELKLEKEKGQRREDKICDNFYSAVINKLRREQKIYPNKTQWFIKIERKLPGHLYSKITKFINNKLEGTCYTCTITGYYNGRYGTNGHTKCIIKIENPPEYQSKTE